MPLPSSAAATGFRSDDILRVPAGRVDHQHLEFAHGFGFSDLRLSGDVDPDALAVFRCGHRLPGIPVFVLLRFRLPFLALLLLLRLFLFYLDGVRFAVLLDLHLPLVRLFRILLQRLRLHLTGHVLLTLFDARDVGLLSNHDLHVNRPDGHPSHLSSDTHESTERLILSQWSVKKDGATRRIAPQGGMWHSSGIMVRRCEDERPTDRPRTPCAGKSRSSELCSSASCSIQTGCRPAGPTHSHGC